MFELKDLKELHDKAYNHNQTTRERASDDMVFYHVTQWDDGIFAEFTSYRGQFDILRKAGRQIISNLKNNPVQVDFEPKDPADKNAGGFMDGLYRSSTRNNSSVEAFDNAKHEAVVCGVGGWILFTEYESSRSGDSNQVIRRRPLFEANNKCFWDPNAKLLDKADADYVSVLHAYSEDGYIKLAESLGVEGDTSPGSFKHPEESYVFPWLAQDKSIYVTEFYHRKLVKTKVMLMTDPFGGELTVSAEQLAKTEDTLIDTGYTITGEKEFERYEVTQYIASGNAILSTQVLAGSHIPVVPIYGERAHVEDEEHYEGITRLAKDPQRLRNFQLSYLADIVSRSPREKAMFHPEQIQGFEDMYEDSGSDNNYPYLLTNRVTAAGEPLPLGPVGIMPAPSIPQPLLASIELTRQAVEDVANPGLPQNIADPDVSGKAVIAMQNRMDQQSMIYQNNAKHAMRRDGEIFASMATEVYDAPRHTKIVKPDGSVQSVTVMEKVIDKKTGEMVTINDLSSTDFDVYSDIGPSYTTQKEQTIDQLSTLMTAIPPGDPTRDVLMLKILSMIDGVDVGDIRKHVNTKLLLLGVKEPESPEEEQLVQQQSQQQNNPDPALLLAQAEQSKADAMMVKEQRQTQKDIADIEAKGKQTDIDAFSAQTDRFTAQTKAQEIDANIDYKRADALSKKIDNMSEASKIYRGALLP